MQWTKVRSLVEMLSACLIPPIFRCVASNRPRRCSWATANSQRVRLVTRHLEQSRISSRQPRGQQSNKHHMSCSTSLPNEKDNPVRGEVMNRGKRDTGHLGSPGCSANLPGVRVDGVCLDCFGKQAVTRDGRFCFLSLRKRINHDNPVEHSKPRMAGMRGYKARSARMLGGSAEILNDGDDD